MAKTTHSYKNRFRTAIELCDVAALQQMQEEKLWLEVNQEEREQLAIGCIDAAEALLAKGDAHLAEFLSWALHLSSDQPDLLHRIDQVLAKAATLPLSESERSRLFWVWGKGWQCLWKWSEEPVDLRHALDKFLQAELLGCHEGAFWADFAELSLACATSANDILLVKQAAEYYAKAVDRSPERMDLWLKLAQTYAELYIYSGDKNFVTRAEAAFIHAQKLDPNCVEVWVSWGTFLAEVGTAEKKIPLLEASVEKFRAAEVLDLSNIKIIWRYCTVFATLGTLADELNLIQEAVDRAGRAIKVDPTDDTEGWVTLGRCLIHLGRYFDETRYFEEAITQLESAISLDDACDVSWHELFNAYLELGDRSDDPAMFEKAASCCQKAVSCNRMRPVYWKDWGVAFLRLAELTGEQSWIEKALPKLEAAIHMRGAITGYADPDWAYHYGCALDFYGDFMEDSDYYRRAVEVLTQVLAVSPPHSHVRYNLALALSHLGEMTGETDYLRQACDLFEKVVEDEEEDETAWCEWGVTLLHLAQLVHDTTYQAVGDPSERDAEAHLLRAAGLGSTQALYYLACCHSLAERYEEAILFFDKAAKAQGLPPLKDMMQDDWLEGLRRTEWFQQFISRLNTNNLER